VTSRPGCAFTNPGNSYLSPTPARALDRPAPWVERRVDGRWTPVPGADATGFSFANDTRTVIGNLLLTTDGRTWTLLCPRPHRIGDGLRAVPDGGLVCVTTAGPVDRDGAPQNREIVTATFLDDDGAERARLRAGPPICLRPTHTGSQSTSTRVSSDFSAGSSSSPRTNVAAARRRLLGVDARSANTGRRLSARRGWRAELVVVPMTSSDLSVHSRPPVGMASRTSPPFARGHRAVALCVAARMARAALRRSGRS
jgi:hypothetical protein